MRVLNPHIADSYGATPGQLPDPNVSLPTLCSNFLQVGQNGAQFFATDDDALNSVAPVFAWAFYTWHGVTSKLTDSNGTLVKFVSGETVTVTILVSEEQAEGAENPYAARTVKFTFDSSVVGVIELTLEDGDLCQQSASWGLAV